MLAGKSSIFKSFWLYGCVAGLFLAVFSAYPQIKLQVTKGSDWQGHYAYNDIDEVAYAAYLKALIDGRPRKNDPYSGRDHSDENPQPESLFSIQFAAPYAVALPARLLGISAPTAMTISGIASAFLTALICFLLIREFSGNTLAGFAGSLFVLCGGALFAGEGAIGEILGTGFPYPYFPFLRRYLPAVPFPVFFFFLFAVWRIISTRDAKAASLWTVTALVAFSFLVFSYFYVWTTAAAWLFCLTVAVAVLRPLEWKAALKRLVWLGLACLLPLAFYAYLLSLRGETMDNVQLLIYSRALDFDRMPLIIGLVMLLVAVLFAVLKLMKARSMHFAFAGATAFVPIVLFNQQLITGLSLQPIHYQVFIGNYVAGLSVFLVAGLVLCKEKVRESSVTVAVLTVVAVLSIVWGFVECHFTVRVLDEANLARDRAYPTGKLLTEKGRSSENPFQDTIMAFSNLYGDDSPTIAPQNVLWARHQHVFAGLNWVESKERFYRQLYFRDLGPEWLDNQLRGGNFVATIALFGWGRHTNRLSANATPLTFKEIEEEVARYRKFYDGFDEEAAYQPEIDFLIVPLGSRSEFQNLSIWYDITRIAETGGHTVYSVKPAKTQK